jgi:predicted RNA methylase
MAKLTKEQLKLGKAAEEMLRKPTLTDQERWFVLENWRPRAEEVTRDKAFFTPMGTSMSVAHDMAYVGTLVDLGAGIGHLSYFVWREMEAYGLRGELICIEKNPRFVEVGKKTVPGARWICGDIFNYRSYIGIEVDFCFSNPPFGNGKTNGWLMKGDMIAQTMEICLRISNGGVFVVPPDWAPYRITGVNQAEKQPIHRQVAGLMEKYSFEYRSSNFTTDDKFDDTSISTEIVHIECEPAGIGRLF